MLLEARFPSDLSSEAKHTSLDRVARSDSHLISFLKDRWLLPSRYDSAIFDPTRDQVPRSKRPTIWQRCVTVTGCPPVSAHQSNKMCGNYSHIDGRVIYLTETSNIHTLFTQML